MTDWIPQLIDETGYAGIFFLMLLETVFPPIPSEVILPVAGVQASQGSFTLWGAIVAGTAGAMAGNFLWYLAARAFGLERFRALVERYGRWFTMDWRDVELAERLFGRFGPAMVAGGRVIPTVRSVVSIPAGLMEMNLRHFLIWSTVGTAIWSSALTVAGWVLGNQYARVEEFIGPISTSLVVLVVVIYVWRQLTWGRRHPAG